MTVRNYTNTSVETALSGGIDAVALSLTVDDATGYPVAPFAIVVDPAVADPTVEEVMLVTAAAGPVWTVTRAYDGTTAKAHAAGATVIHAAIAADFVDAQAAGMRYTYATGTLTLAVQPTVGDTITIGGLTYTYVDTFPNPGEIFIDVDLATTQVNTVSNINQGIAATFPDAGAVAFSGDVCAIVAAAVGAAGNGIVTTSAFTDPLNFFGQAVLAGGTDGTDSGHLQAQSATLTGSSAATPILRLQASAGLDELAASNLLELVDANDNELVKIDSGGNLYTLRDLRLVDPTNIANFTIQSDGKIFFRVPDENDTARWLLRGSIPGNNDVLMFALRPSANKTALINAHAPGAVAIEIDTSGEVGVSADLIQAFGNANFDLVFRLMQGGAVVIAQHSAPDDSQLNTGDMALWFDQTNGASKLMIKAKDETGTVVTGEAALT